MEDRFKRCLDKVSQIGLVIFIIGMTTSITVEETGVVIILLALFTGLFFKKYRLTSTAMTIPILVYVFGAFFSSFFVSPEPLHSFKTNLHNFWKILFFYAMFFVFSFEEFKKTLKILLPIVMIVSLYGIIQFFTGIELVKRSPLVPEGQYFQAIGFSGLHLTFGGIMSMISLVAFGLFFENNSIKLRAFYLTVTSLSFLATLASMSRSAIVGVFFGFFFFFIMNFKKTYKYLIVFILLVFTVIVVFPPVTAKFKSVFAVKQDPRAEVWGTAINAIKANPILGIGAGIFQKQYDHYRSGWLWWGQGHPHNDILGAYLDGGLIGLLGYLLIFFVLVLIGIRGYFITNSYLLLGLTSSIIVMFFQGLSQCYFMTAINLWVFWFFASGISIFAKENKLGLKTLLKLKENS